MKEHKKNHHEPKKKDENPEASTIEIPVEEYESLKSRVQELEGLREKFIHAAADFENAKKRNTRDKDEFIKFTQEKILGDLLPALDNFERAINHATALSIPDADEETLRKHFKSLTSGVLMVQKQILDVLKMYGLARLKTVGEKFDPHFHEVVGYVTDEGEEDRIVDELEAGYKLHDRLLRAAKVRIRVSPTRRDTSQDKEDEIT